jgi:hypothetical protein
LRKHGRLKEAHVERQRRRREQMRHSELREAKQTK